jgi:hypothetical protein
MNKLDRRSVLGIGLTAASAAMIKPAAAQTMGYKIYVDGGYHVTD